MVIFNSYVKLPEGNAWWHMVCQLARVAKLEVANSIDWGGPHASSIWATPYSLPSKPYRGSTWIGVTGALGTRHIPTAGYTYIFELYCHTNHKHIKMTCNDLLIKPKIQLQICSSIIQYDINMMHQKRDGVEEVEQVLTNRVVLLLQTKYIRVILATSLMASRCTDRANSVRPGT